MKKLILTGCIALASMGLYAQKAYDFAMVYPSDLKSVIYVVENDKEERLVPASGKQQQIQERVLRTVSEMTLEGWEVINVGNNSTFYLRRPKK